MTIPNQVQDQWPREATHEDEVDNGEYSRPNACVDCDHNQAEDHLSGAAGPIRPRRCRNDGTSCTSIPVELWIAVLHQGVQHRHHYHYVDEGDNCAAAGSQTLTDVSA